MERRLTVVPMSGLGNRMRVVASVAEAAKDIEGRIRIVWQPTWDCRARFADLFLPIEEETPPYSDFPSAVPDAEETSSDLSKTTSETSLSKAGFMRSVAEGASSASAPLNNAPNSLKTTSEQIQTTSESFQKDCRVVSTLSGHDSCSALVASPQTEVTRAKSPLSSEDSDLFRAVSDGRLTIDEGDWRDRVATKRNFWLPMLYRRLHYRHEERNFRPSDAPDIRSMARRYPTLYVATCYELAPYSPRTIRRCFRPLPELRDHIVGISSQYTSRTLGVHVRRTDNVTAIRRSPLIAFRRRIDRLLDDGMADALFLCTDSDEVRRYFRETYGRRVLTRQIAVHRDTLQGMRDAVIDLWCLALTSRILGSYYSSFSEIAAELTGVPFEVAVADESSSN